MTKIENKNRFMRHFFMRLFLKTDLEFESEFIVRIATHAPDRNLLFQLQLLFLWYVRNETCIGVVVAHNENRELLELKQTK